MTSDDREKQAREVVSDRLRLFFNRLREQLARSAEEFRKRIETAIDGQPK